MWEQISKLLFIFIVLSCVLGFASELWDIESRLNKFLCFLGKHKMHKKINGRKRIIYRCLRCKKTRKHPDLKLIDGGSKIGYNKYTF